MPWLQPFPDPTLAELAARSNISGGGGISSGLLRPPPNQWLEALNQVAPVIRDYMQKKKSDEIANQLMNMQQPPRAEAVDYPQGIPATEPFTGGVDQMQVNQAYQAYLDKQREQQWKQEDRGLDSQYKKSQIYRNYQPSATSSRVPVKVNGETYMVTPNEALRHYDRATKTTDQAGQFDKDYAKKYGLTSSDLDQLDIPSLDFQTESGQQADYNKETGAVADPKKTYVVGKAGGKTIRIPFNEWTEMMTRRQNLPSQSAAEPSTATRYDSPPTIQTKEERDALPSGTVYIGPDGKKHRKP